MNAEERKASLARSTRALWRTGPHPLSPPLPYRDCDDYTPGADGIVYPIGWARHE
jgi:hypothetical protein